MKRNLALACLLSAAILAGRPPMAAFAAGEGFPCENHPEHTAECGYTEGLPCSHVCVLCGPEDSAERGVSDEYFINSADMNAAVSQRTPLPGT